MDGVTIGLTGGTGTIGQRLLMLQAKNYQFIVPTTKTDISDLYKHENIKYIKTQNYSKDFYVKCFKECSAVIHAGAITPKTVKRSDDLEVYIPNLISSDELFRACMELSISNVVNLSSCAVYPKTGLRKFEEEDRGIPRNKYGVIKKTIEDLGEYYSNNYDMRIKSIRISMVIDSNIFLNDDLISTYVKCCVNHKPICVYGDGEGVNDYIWIDDVIQGIMVALNHPKIHGIYNIASGDPVSALSAAKCICEIFDHKQGFVFDKSKDSSPIRSAICIEKAKHELGYEPNNNFRKAIINIKESLNCEA